MKKIATLFVIIFTLILVPTIKVNASYNYTPWQDTIYSAHAMSLIKVINTANIKRAIK